jgi:hypothetical protein
MSKDANKRLNDTVMLLQRALPSQQQQARELANILQQRLMTSFITDQARTTLSGELSLGGWHLADGTRRHFQRLYLLCERLVGGSDSTGLDTAAMTIAKRDSAHWSEAQLKLRIAVIAGNALNRLAQPGTVQMAESWEYALAPERTLIEPAIAKARRLLGQAYQGVQAVTADSRSKANFVKWFGAADLAKTEQVKDNIQAMYTRLLAITLKVYYRGNGCRNQLDDIPGEHYHSPHVRLNVDSDYGYVVPNFGGNAEPDRTHVLIGTSFFDPARCSEFSSDTSTVQTSDNAMVYSRAGVFVHEMAHVAFAARDIHLNRDVWTNASLRGLLPGDANGGKTGVAGYGGRCAQILATRHPALAVVNADNYRLFCDFYDHDRVPA